MRKVMFVLLVVTMVVLFSSLLAQVGGKKIRLVTGEVSLGRIHPGIIGETLVVSPDSKRFAYGARRGKNGLSQLMELKGRNMTVS